MRMPAAVTILTQQMSSNGDSDVFNHLDTKCPSIFDLRKYCRFKLWALLKIEALSTSRMKTYIKWTKICPIYSILKPDEHQKHNYLISCQDFDGIHVTLVSYCPLLLIYILYVMSTSMHMCTRNLPTTCTLCIRCIVLHTHLFEYTQPKANNHNDQQKKTIQNWWQCTGPTDKFLIAYCLPVFNLIDRWHTLLLLLRNTPRLENLSSQFSSINTVLEKIHVFMSHSELCIQDTTIVVHSDSQTGQKLFFKEWSPFRVASCRLRHDMTRGRGGALFSYSPGQQSSLSIGSESYQYELIKPLCCRTQPQIKSLSK